MSQSRLQSCHARIIDCMRRMASCRPHNKSNLFKVIVPAANKGWPEWSIIQHFAREDNNIYDEILTTNDNGIYNVTRHGKSQKSCVNLDEDIIDRSYTSFSLDKTAHKKIHDEGQEWWLSLMSEAYQIIHQNPGLIQARYSDLFGLAPLYDYHNRTTEAIISKFKELGLLTRDANKKYRVVAPFKYEPLSFEIAQYSHSYKYSLGEALIMEWCDNCEDLESYQQQVTFPGLKDKKNLYFDAQIELNDGTEFLVEYDGKQHTEFTPYFHKTIERFQESQNRDRVKDTWARDHEIPLLRIQWNENVAQCLDRFVCELREQS